MDGEISLVMVLIVIFLRPRVFLIVLGTRVLVIDLPWNEGYLNSPRTEDILIVLRMRDI